MSAARDSMASTLASARRTTPTLVVLTIFFVVSLAHPCRAASHKTKAPCKQIKEAVLAGKTLDQITAEFQVDEQQVVKCTQGKSKHRKSKSHTAKPKHSAAATAQTNGATKPSTK